MSLKAFHIVFIIFSTLLALGTGVWCLWVNFVAGAPIYVAGATDDASFDDAQRSRLEQSLSDAGVEHTIETYPAAHGFAVSDNPTHDASAEERHWQALADFFDKHLSR